MAKVSKECIELIEALPESGAEAVKAVCLTKSTREMTPKQKAWREKFSKCAAEAKGKPDYRARMTVCLRK